MAAVYRHRPRYVPAALTGLTLSLIAMLIPSVDASSAAEAPSAHTASNPAPRSSSSCTDVIFVGARGSGEGPQRGSGSTPSSTNAIGPRMWVVWKTLETAAQNQGLTSSYRAVAAGGGKTYWADGVAQDLAPTKAQLNLIAEAYAHGGRVAAIAEYIRLNVRPYMASVQAGIAVTEWLVRHLVETCPTSQLVLGGYSQGAIAIHDAENAFKQSSDPATHALLSHIAATLLLGDPDRAPNTKAKTFGTAPVSGEGLRAYFHMVKPHDVAQPSTTAEVQGRHDIVGDFNSWDFGGKASEIATFATIAIPAPVVMSAAALYLVWKIKIGPRIRCAGVVHSNYDNPNEITTKCDGTVVEKAWLVAAAKWVAGKVRPRPTITSTVLPNGTVGQAYTATLTTADHRAGTWSISSGSLPGGLTLSANTISGLPTTAGSYPFTLTFKSTTGNASTITSITVGSASTPAASDPTWTLQTLPAPLDESSRPVAAVADVCAAVSLRTQCVVAGLYQASDGQQGALWMLHDDQWSVTRAPLPAGGVSVDGITGVSYRESGGPGTEPGPRCGASGRCVVFGQYLDNAGMTEPVLWIWDGTQWSAAEPTIPADATSNPNVLITSASCGAGAICAMTLTYASTSGLRNYEFGIWSNGAWTYSPVVLGDRDNYDTRAPESGITCSSDACVSNLRYPHAWTGGPVDLGDIWTWQAGSWTEGLPDDNQTPSHVACGDDFCLASGYGYRGTSWGDTIWKLEGGQWTLLDWVPRPDNVWSSSIYAMSCAQSLCAIRGGYGYNPTRAWILQNNTIQEVDTSAAAYDLSDVSCSPAFCATTVGQVFDAATGHWVTPPVPSPAGNAEPLDVGCVLAGCAISGSFATQVDGQTAWTPTAWALVGGTWLRDSLTPIDEPTEWSAGSVTCGAEECLVGNSYINGSSTGQVWLSSPFAPEG